MVRAALLWCVLGLWTAEAVAQQDPAKVQIQTQELAPGVYMLVGDGGNIGVSAGADGIFLIDDQFAPLTEKIRAALARLQPGPVRFVFNTHWHGDHTGGNENFGGAGALIVAHDGVRARLSREQTLMGQRIAPAPAVALPVVTFGADLSFHLNGDVIQALHVAHAHTDGDAILRFERANVLHMGDTYLSGMYPFIDTSSGGSLEGLIAAAERGLALSDARTRIIPGHGPLSDRAGLERYRDMLLTVRDRARAALAAGQTREKWIASRPTADLDASWGYGFMKPEVFLGLVWDSLAGTGR
jgi:glyoxylase-like metal-dependent hydrolase (beta-lactamase superfamily II)